MNGPRIVYALLCILVPMAWGLMVVWISNMIDRRLQRGKKQATNEQTLPPIDYHI